MFSQINVAIKEADLADQAERGKTSLSVVRLLCSRLFPPDSLDISGKEINDLAEIHTQPVSVHQARIKWLSVYSQRSTFSLLAL